MGMLGKVGVSWAFSTSFYSMFSDLSGLRVQWQLGGAQARAQVGERRAGVP